MQVSHRMSAVAVLILAGGAPLSAQTMRAEATPGAAHQLAPPRSLDRYLDGAVLYAGIDDLKAFGAACSELKIAGLFEEDFVQELLALAGEQEGVFFFKGAEGFLASDLAAKIPDPQGMVEILEGIRGGVGFALLDAKDLESGARVAFGIDLGDKGEKACSWIGGLLAHFAEAKQIEFRREQRPGGTLFSVNKVGAGAGEKAKRAYLGIADGYLIGSNVTAPLDQLLAGEGTGALAEQSSYREACSELRRPDGIFGYIDLHALMEETLPEAKRDTPEMQVMASLGLFNLSYLGISVHPEQEAMRYRARLRVAGGLPLLDRAFGGKREFGALALAPANTLAAVSLAVQPREIFNIALELLEEHDQNKYEQVIEGVEFVREMAGVDLEEDVLGEMGSEISLVASPSPSPLPIPDLYVILELRDAGSLDRLLGILTELGGEDLQFEEIGRGRYYSLPEAALEDIKIEGFAAIGRYVVFAIPIPMSRPRLVLKRILQPAKGGAALSECQGFRHALQCCGVPEENATLQYYFDWPGLAESIYKPAKAFAPFAIDDERILELLPDPEVLQRHLMPAAGVLRLDQRGLWYESYSVF